MSLSCSLTQCWCPRREGTEQNYDGISADTEKMYQEEVRKGITLTMKASQEISSSKPVCILGAVIKSPNMSTYPKTAFPACFMK